MLADAPRLVQTIYSQFSVAGRGVALDGTGGDGEWEDEVFEGGGFEPAGGGGGHSEALEVPTSEILECCAMHLQSSDATGWDADVSALKLLEVRSPRFVWGGVTAITIYNRWSPAIHHSHAGDGKGRVPEILRF